MLAYFVLQADKNSIISKVFIFLLDANKNVLRIYRSWLTKVKETVEVKFKKILKGTHWELHQQLEDRKIS